MYCLHALVKECAEGIDIFFVARGDEDAVLAQTGHPALLQVGQGEVLSLNRREVVFLLGDIGKIVYFVEDHNTWLFATIGDL